MLLRVVSAVLAAFAALFALGWVLPESLSRALGCLAASALFYVLSTIPTGRLT